MSVQYVKDCVDLVKGLGGRIVTVVPGEVGRIKSADGVDPEEEWQWGIASMRECAKYAREQKITLGIEPLNRFETNFINNHKQALKLAEAAGDDVGVCLDAFHINIEEEDMYEAIEAKRKEKMEDPYGWLELHRPRTWGFRQMGALMRDFDKRLTALEKAK